jgi:hypothetical protein
MLETLFTDGNRLGFKVTGHLAADELGDLYAMVENSLADFDKTHLYVEVGDYTGFDTQFVAVNLRRSFAMLGKLSSFGRVAIVADQTWLRRVARLESALLPHISYEVYPLAERELAMAWLKGEVATPHRPALSIIATDQDNVVGFEIAGRLAAADLHLVAQAVETALAGHEKISLLGRFKHFDGVDATSLGDAEYLHMKWSLLGHLDRYALVGAPHWLSALAQGLSPIIPGRIRAYAAEAEEQAWCWLNANPRGAEPSQEEKEQYLAESNA